MSALRRALSKFKSNGKDIVYNHAEQRAEHKAVAKVRESEPSSSSDSDGPLNENGERMSKSQLRRHNKRESQDFKRRQSLMREREVEDRKREEDERAAKEEPPEVRARYGTLPLLVSKDEDWKHEKRTQIDTISSKNIGETITFRCRVETFRKMSAKLGFFVFRQQLMTIQGVLLARAGAITPHMVKWAERIPAEAIVLVTGVVQKPKEEVKGAQIHDAEVFIEKIHIVTQMTEPLPFNVYEAELSRDKDNEQHHKSHITDRTLLFNRIIDLRTPTSQGVFRINSGVCNLFRTYLDSQGFVEIHTPKLQGSATESGSSVFEVNYFGRPAYLAQSPQLAKQMCIAADMERVYEVGPIFRAENSNTHRHLTEYTGLDIEMSIEEHYHEALTMIDNALKFVFKGIYERYRREVDVVKKHFPHEDLVWLDQTPIIPFKEGIQMLIDSGWKDEDGKEPSPYEDLHTRDEIRLGQLVKEKYHTDYYILDKFPSSPRPFYTMPDPNDDRFTNSYDIFVRGQEILSGGQRIHDATLLESRMRKQGIDPNDMEDYMQGFRWGAPPHAGGGIGLERIVMLILALGNVRWASLFPRDPKSLPARPPVSPLRYPEASTLHPPWEGGKLEALLDKEFQPLEKLIANYGDSTNTAWLDDRYQVWRHEDTGAAVGFVPSEGFACILGDPLCEKSQYTLVVRSFLQWLKKKHGLKPVWLLASRDVEEILGNKLGWRTLSCAAEERADPAKNPAEDDPAIKRKVRHAEKEGVKIFDVAPFTIVPDDIQRECDARMKDWLANRKGTQVHLTALHPWRDPEHRIVSYARDASGKICALIVLAQLAPQNGYQIKYSLDFPGAPGGTIEYITIHAMHVAREAGAKRVTFGGAATATLTPGKNLSGFRVKFLSRSYNSIASQLKLTAKGEFREKLGATEDPVYVCYPEYGLGTKGIHAILTFFEADEE
ncbi:MAG: hypothetical protein M1819_006225 [Sarea resinae]|nr:MAG: hypothetical protein M1819_006225 [Sarea resinae]